MMNVIEWNAEDSSLNRLFRDMGIIVVRGAFGRSDLAPLQMAFVRLIRARLASLGEAPGVDDDLDTLFNRLCSLDSAFGDQVASIGRDLPEYFALLGHPALRRCVQAVMPTEQMLLAYDVCLMRIDRPSDHRRDFDWHYDYPYNMLSKSAVTVWLPLTDVTEEMGAMRVIPGSHDRIWPVELHKEMLGGKGTGHKVFRLADLDVQDLEARSVSLPVRAGDIVIFSPLLLHRSGRNTSGRSRWVFNPRYSDALDPEILARGWRSTRFSSPLLFADLHPEALRPPR